MSDQYYLQDNRTIVGNCMMFWRAGGGYTSNVSEAEVFTKDAAIKQNQCRGSDVPWPKPYIDARLRQTVDVQYVREEEAFEISCIVLNKPKKEKIPVSRCAACGKFIPRHFYQFCGDCRDESY